LCSSYVNTILGISVLGKYIFLPCHADSTQPDPLRPVRSEGWPSNGHGVITLHKKSYILKNNATPCSLCSSYVNTILGNIFSCHATPIRLDPIPWPVRSEGRLSNGHGVITWHKKSCILKNIAMHVPCADRMSTPSDHTWPLYVVGKSYILENIVRHVPCVLIVCHILGLSTYLGIYFPAVPCHANSTRPPNLYGTWDESVRQRAGSQWIVAARPLCHLQCPVAYLSRLQRILPAARVKLAFKAAARSSSAARAWPMARARRGGCPYCGSGGTAGSGAGC
jgi:hypothetical protein